MLLLSGAKLRLHAAARGPPYVLLNGLKCCHQAMPIFNINHAIRYHKTILRGIFMGGNHRVPLKVISSKSKLCAQLQRGLDVYQNTGDRLALCVELKQIIKASGGISYVADKAGISRSHLSYLLSGKCSPMLDTYIIVLKAIGYRMQVSVDDGGV